MAEARDLKILCLLRAGDPEQNYSKVGYTRLGSRDLLLIFRLRHISGKAEATRYNLHSSTCSVWGSMQPSPNYFSLLLAQLEVALSRHSAGMFYVAGGRKPASSGSGTANSAGRSTFRSLIPQLPAAETLTDYKFHSFVQINAACSWRHKHPDIGVNAASRF